MNTDTLPEKLPAETEPEISDQSTGDAEAQPSTNGKHRSKGKVARLPKELRDEINVMLRDGVSYPAILEKLRDRGNPELHSLSEQNLSNWKNAGHQVWLREQEWREEMQQECEGALQFPGADDQAKLEQVALKMASMRLYQLFKHLNPATFTGVAQEKPEAYTRLFSVLPRITRESLRFQKYREACAKAQAAIKTLRDPMRKLSDQERRSLVRMVDDILGLPSQDDPSEVGRVTPCAPPAEH